MNRQEAIKKRTLDARQRMLRAHMKTLGTATLEQLETSTAQIIKHAPCDPTVNGGEMPHAKAIQRCLEALSAFLLDEEPRAQKGWDSFTSTTFPATMRGWFNQACKAAAGQFDAGVTKKLKAWKKGIGYAERIMNDPALAPSQIRKMSTAGHQVGIPVSVFVRAGCSFFRAASSPPSLAAWATACDACKADDDAQHDLDVCRDGHHTSETARDAAQYLLDESRRVSSECSTHATDLVNRHTAALARFGELESTRWRWDGRNAWLAAHHAHLNHEAACAAAVASFAGGLPLAENARKNFVDEVRKLCAVFPSSLEIHASLHVQVPRSSMKALAPLSDDDVCDLGGQGEGRGEG